MKKIIEIIITITVAIILVGCSSAADKGANNGGKSNGNDTTSKNASLSSDQESQREDTSTEIKDINNNESSKLLESIDTTKSQFEKGYYDYNGTINGNIPIRMSIYPLEKDMVGTYYYEKHSDEMKLKGKAGDKNIILYEYDETGKNTGTFQGTMSTVDKIEGTWISADNKTSYPFVLSLEDILPGAEYGKRYAIAVYNKSDQDVETFISEIQSYIVNDNKEKLAEEIAYPVNVKINGQVIKIQNKDELIENYDQIFNADYKQGISNAPTKYLFVNYQGIMFDGGNIWINDVMLDDSNSELKITAINN
ncbi:hypothetical protein [uncultured Clostridium sp.]|uniref:hypothetical protein n=1 Tax=uncultured Clostridium sp. TaxID=59620 RepID=UPI0028E2AAF4|nr:hypothetical protein [uncultured Clostridium sp.]